MVKRRGEKLYSLVFRQIRAYILQNNLQPGDLLPTEQALVDMLGVSRNVLREAIKSMELLHGVCHLAGARLKAFNLVLCSKCHLRRRRGGQRRRGNAGHQKTAGMAIARLLKPWKARTSPASGRSGAIRQQLGGAAHLYGLTASSTWPFSPASATSPSPP